MKKKTMSLLTGLVVMAALAGCGRATSLSPNAGNAPGGSVAGNLVSNAAGGQTAVADNGASGNLTSEQAGGGIAGGTVNSSAPGTAEPSDAGGSAPGETAGPSGGVAVPAEMPLSDMDLEGLDAVSFADGTTGFVAGKSGILRTRDGGRTWAQVYVCPDPILGIDAKRPPQDKAQGGQTDGRVNVWAYTYTYLLASTDGRYFTRVNVPGLGQGHITSLSALPDAGVWLAAGGAVYVSDPMNGALQKRSPAGAAVTEVAAVSDDVAYAAAGRSVYRTTDAGRHWTKVFTAQLRQEDDLGVWQPRLVAAGNDVWVMFYGGGAGMSQVAYVIYHSGDGSHFTPVAYEGTFQGLYPSIQLPPKANIGAQPGPMQALSGGRAVFLGWEPRGFGDSVLMTATPDGGKSLQTQPVKTADSQAPDFFSGIALSFTDPAHGWIAGTTMDKKPVVLKTTDGGRSWTPVP